MFTINPWQTWSIPRKKLYKYWKEKVGGLRNKSHSKGMGKNGRTANFFVVSQCPLLYITHGKNLKA